MKSHRCARATIWKPLQFNPRLHRDIAAVAAHPATLLAQSLAHRCSTTPCTHDIAPDLIFASDDSSRSGNATSRDYRHASTLHPHSPGVSRGAAKKAPVAQRLARTTSAQRLGENCWPGGTQEQCPVTCTNGIPALVVSVRPRNSCPSSSGRVSAGAAVNRESARAQHASKAARLLLRVARQEGRAFNE